MFIPVRSAGGGLHWNGRRLAAGLAETCEMKCRDRVTFKSHGKELDVPIEYGSPPVRLPEHPDVELSLVVVKWPRCEKPMMLLTTLRAARSRKSLRQVVEGYLTRWRVEETIRFVKQAYEVEDMRLLRFGRLKAMVAIVLATAYFAMAWLGLGDKLAVLADHVKRVSKWQVERPRRPGQGAGRTVPDDSGSVAATSGNATGRQRQRGQALARPLGPGVPRQPFCHLGIVQCNARLKAATRYGILWAMKDFALTNTNTHHAGRVHMRFVAALAFSLAASALFAAPSDEPFVCYRPDVGKNIYPWDHAAKWFDTTGNGSSINRVPTTNDYVFLYSSKNDVGANGKPMVVTNGVHAETGVLEICDKWNGYPYLIGVTVQNGGTMTNEGAVYVGNCGSGKTGGGLLTVESGGVWTANGVFMLGCSSGTSWLNVNPGGSFSCAQEFRIGYQYGSGIVTNEGTMTVVDVFPGVSGTGVLVNKGDLTIARKLTIGRYLGSSGHVILESGSRIEKQDSSAPVHIAFANKSTGILECRSDLKFASSTWVSVANGTNSTGRLVIGEGAVVSNASSIAIGAKPLSCGSVELHGGALYVRGDNVGHRVTLGLDGETTTGRISGWGSVRRVDSTLRIRFFGQVIADGEGEARDLNMASFRTVGTNNTENLNGCGTNGWFAVNKGRLIYPRAQNCSGASHPTIGDYPNRAEPTVMNSFRYTLDKPRPEGTYYNFAELYAPDREDIPAGLPVRGRDVVAGVWRFGLSSATGPDIDPEPVSFTGMNLTFRYDWRKMREGQSVYVYRHDGSANGAWTRIGKAELSSVENVITTDKFDASSETWNAGWFAVVAQNTGGATIIFR